MDDKEIRSMDKFEKRNTSKRIKVQINKGEREYDVYALLTSFFPGVEVVTAAEAEGEFEGLFEIKEEGANITISLNFEEIDKAKDFEIKSAEKDAAKKEFGLALYDFLCECTGKELPWGNLTGIRPTKLIRTMLEEELDSVPGSLCVPGSVIDKIKERAYAERRLRGEKLDLGIDIAKREIEIMSRLHGTDGYSVYVGIPFCPSTCLYCSFTSNPIFKYKDKIKNYLLAIKKELEWDVSHLSDRYLDTIYIGGGTPTTLSPEELDELLGYITNILPMESVREFTIEAGRADSITKEKLDVIKKYPITRISVNPQTMSDKTLKTIGRNHTVKQFVDAFNLVREAGFDNINSDIILGLPGETVEDVDWFQAFPSFQNVAPTGRNLPTEADSLPKLTAYSMRPGSAAEVSISVAARHAAANNFISCAICILLLSRSAFAECFPLFRFLRQVVRRGRLRPDSQCAGALCSRRLRLIHGTAGRRL